MIPEFKNEYRWLSNFYPCEINVNGQRFRTVEHAYQSYKSDDPNWKKFCFETKSPGKVKIESHNLEYDKNLWVKKSLKIMEECLTQKYNQEPFRSLLLDTGEEYLQEGNDWDDTFWGVDIKTRIGKNNLGRLIMLIRDRLTGKVW